MWIGLAVAYAAGVIVTWFDLRSGAFTGDPRVGGVLALLWPLYWLGCLWSFIVNRKSR
jgi:hypothetical protein